MAEASEDAVTSVPCHLEGITRLCFSPDGSTIFTGGSDCLVRIHKAEDVNSEPSFHDNHTDAITSLSCSSSNLITSSLDNIARVFSYPANEFEGFITRSSGVPIRWVSIDPSGQRVAVCSDDLLVKVVDVKETSRVTHLMDYNKSARSAVWDPTGKYLVTASCDGKLRIYDVSGSGCVIIRVMEGVISSSDSDSTTSSYVAWHPSGTYFAVALRTNEIAIVNVDGWGKQTSFSTSGPKTAISELAWSPNGRYLASAAGKQISVWSNDTKQMVAKYTEAEGSISGLCFSPISNFLAFTSLDGSFYRWTKPVPSNLPDPVASETVRANQLDRLLDDDFGDDDEDMEDKGEGVEDLFGDGDDWIVDDDGVYGAEDGERTRGGRTEVVNVTKAQEAFTPGSTSMRNKKRYLTFNMIGAIDVTDQETHHVVNVEFHDKSAHRGYHFQDLSKFSMASLGEQGIVYGSPAEGDQPSTIHYRPYDSWASQSEWTMPLLTGEDVVCVAAGGGSSDDTMAMGSVIVATSRGYIRFLSSSGIQRYIWRIGQDIVTMASGKDAVMIVHREGGTSLDGCQNLRFTLISLDNFDFLQEGSIPLPKKTTLTWVGFSSDGTPAMYDSTGLLSVLDKHRKSGQARWVPVLDSVSLKKEGRSDSYWPVGVTEARMACIILKGSEKEPWFPRPLIQEVELQMPLLNIDNQQGQLEESVIRGSIALSSLQDSLFDSSDPADLEMSIKTREVALDKLLLQLVQGACKADNLQRALDVARLMHNPATVEGAAKVAAFYHLPGLQERIQGVKVEKESGSIKDRKSRRPTGAKANGTAQFGDFAPRQGKRTFGGVQRDTTPAASGRSETFIPETPGIESTPLPSALRGEIPRDASPSPEGKRRRPDEEEDFVVRKKADETLLSNGASKNPFTKKPPGSNPFAKPAVAKPLDAIKSTSFFERVDNIESSGASKASVKPKRPAKDSAKNGQVPNGKQTTLFGMKKGLPGRPALQAQESTSTETDEAEETQDEETLGTVCILEESLVQETMEPEEMEMS